MRPSERSARRLRAEPTGGQPGPVCCLRAGAHGSATELSAATLQPSGSTRTVACQVQGQPQQERNCKGSWKEAPDAVQEVLPGRNARDRARDLQSLYCWGHGENKFSLRGNQGTPTASFLYLDDNA